MSNPPVRPGSVDVDRRWVGRAVAISLAATILGLSRFGYGVLLPPMREDLGWTYAQAGSLETGSAVGYLAGALACPLLLRRIGETAALRLCAGVTAGSLLGCAVTDQLAVLFALRAVGGASAAALFVAGGLVAARLATITGRPGPVLGTYYAGVGPGILLTALLAPTVLTDPGRWQVGWLVLGLLAASCAVLAGYAAGGDAALPATPSTDEESHPPLRWALAAFALFGVGYVPFATFAVAYWQQASASTALVTSLWVVLALAATASGLLWRRLLANPSRALVMLLAVVTIGVALPLISTAIPALAMSSALFGSGFLAVSAATTALIRSTRPQPQWSPTLATFTATFATGQVAGPVLTGLLADHVGLRGGLAVAATFLALATTAAWRHHAHTRPTSRSAIQDSHPCARP